MRKLRVYFKCFARFLKMLKNIRNRHAHGVIKYKFLRNYRNWKRTQYIRKRETVLNISEESLIFSIMFSMMAKWKFKVCDI